MVFQIGSLKLKMLIFVLLVFKSVSSSDASAILLGGKNRPNMPPFAGRCDHFPWANLWYEICWFKSVRQNDGYDRSYIAGYYKGWERQSKESGAGGAITTTKSYSQVYDSGESCDEFGARRTRVTIMCSGAQGSKNKLIKVEENQACKYLLTVEIDASICDNHFNFLDEASVDVA